LLTEDVLFKARAWNLKTMPSIDPSDSLGANTFLDVMNNEVQRTRPKPNTKVNAYFVSDEGRFMYHRIRSEDRLATPVQPDPSSGELLAAPWEAALDFIDEKMRAAGPDGVVLVSTHATQEEIEAAKAYAEALGGARVARIPNALVTEDQTFPGGFVIPGDKSPNTAGATQLVPAALEETDISESTPVVLVLNSSVRAENISPENLDKMLAADYVFAIDVLNSPLVQRAFLSLAGRMWAEKSGTYVNRDGIAQTFDPAVVGPLQSRDERDILRELTRRAAVVDQAFATPEPAGAAT